MCLGRSEEAQAARSRASWGRLGWLPLLSAAFSRLEAMRDISTTCLPPPIPWTCIWFSLWTVMADLRSLGGESDEHPSPSIPSKPRGKGNGMGEAGQAWLCSGPAAEQGWRSEAAPICAGGGTSMMHACQSCTNSHEVGCKTGGGASVQGWLRHPETQPGNHSSREPLPGAGHPARDPPTPAHPSPTLQAWAAEEACSVLPAWLCAAQSPAYPSPPGQDTYCGGQP